MPAAPRTRVKICGVNAPDAVDAALTHGADWIGLVFFPRSPRFLTPAEAAALAASLVAQRPAGGPALVGLFVEPTDEQIAATLAAVPLDILQLYATPARATAIATRFARPVWRSVPVATTADLPPTTDGAAALLIEPRPPATATRPGGNSTLLDWSLLADWHPAYPWLLAGGLTPDNVAAAIAATGAPAVDVSSGVETAPGVKSPALIEAFIKAARGG